MAGDLWSRDQENTPCSLEDQELEVGPRVKTIKNYFLDSIIAENFDQSHKKAMTQFEGRSPQLGVRLHSMFLCLGLGFGPNAFTHTNFDSSNIIIL